MRDKWLIQRKKTHNNYTLTFFQNLSLMFSSVFEHLLPSQNKKSFFLVAQILFNYNMCPSVRPYVTISHHGSLYVECLLFLNQAKIL